MRFKTLLGILSALIFIVLIFNWFGVGGEKIRTAEVGDTFLIELESSPTTGYTWQADFDEEMLSLESTNFEVKYPDRAGSPGTRSFTFKALKEGSVNINFTYSKQWENKQPLKEKEYRIIIRSIRFKAL